MHKKTTDDGQLSLFEPAEEKIIKQEYSDIMKQSYIDYAMSVIIARAVPDIRDGLKPVQRRILYDMGEELGLDYNKPYRKSARIVGDTMGKFHPHGDSSIYDAMVVMAQDFKREIPLVDGHGNFGSIEGDGAAAQRYTESRLQKITQENYLADLDKKVVDYVPNYDETEKEPEVLPVKIPNFLINGSEGIAVGMTTSTPSHNLVEVLKAEEYLIDTPCASIEELLDFVNRMEFDRLGVFPYSAEEDTPAATMEDQIPEEVKEARRDEIMELQQEISLEKGESRVGQVLTAMIEGKVSGESAYIGRTYGDAPKVDGYIFVQTGELLMTGDFARVRVTGALEYDLIGELEDEYTE